MRQTWDQIHSLPPDRDSGVNSWICIGPFGSTNIGSPPAKYSGRLLDIDDADGILRIASASGGTWSPLFNGGPPLSDQISSLACGTLAAQPGTDGQYMLLGTGEPFIRTGTGLWRTGLFGDSWTNIPMYPEPTAFFRIRYTPGNPQRVHAATDMGYYRSDDGGQTWTLKLYGTCTDLAVGPQTSHIVYTAIYGDGLWIATGLLLCVRPVHSVSSRN